MKTPAFGLGNVSKLGVRENRLASMGTSTGERSGRVHGGRAREGGYERMQQSVVSGLCQ